MKRPRESMRQCGFSDSGNIFNQQMATGKERNYSQPNGFVLAFDHGLDGLLQALDLLHRVGGD